MDNSSSFPEAFLEGFRRTGVVATLTIDDARDAIALALALRDGGVVCLEFTLRTPCALEAIGLIHREVPEVVVGAGTVLSPAQVEACLEAGAAFGVAPGTNPRVVAEAQAAGLPFAPGICTPSDIERALEAGCTVMKFFPAEPSGGLPYLRSIAAPFTHLGVEFIPLGGVDEQNAESYLREPLILAVGGSWLAPRELVQRRDWTAITARARQASDLVKRVREELS